MREKLHAELNRYGRNNTDKIQPYEIPQAIHIGKWLWLLYIAFSRSSHPIDFTT